MTRVTQKPIFTTMQLKEIRLGLKEGVDVISYAKPNILPEAMKGIRTFLKKEKERCKKNK